MLVIKDGAPVIITINDRRYTVCNEPCFYEDGTPLQGPGKYCGQLIDVTDARGVKATDSCGDPENHIVRGIDAVVIP